MLPNELRVLDIFGLYSSKPTLFSPFAPSFFLGGQTRVSHDFQDRPPKTFLIWTMLRDLLLGWLRQLLAQTNYQSCMQSWYTCMLPTPQAFLLLCTALRYGFWPVTTN